MPMFSVSVIENLYLLALIHCVINACYDVYVFTCYFLGYDLLKVFVLNRVCVCVWEGSLEFLTPVRGDLMSTMPITSHFKT